MITAFFVISGLVVLLAIGMPLGFASAFMAVVVLFMKFEPAVLMDPTLWGEGFLTGRPGSGPLNILSQRIYGDVMTSYVLISIPLFIFMAALLERWLGVSASADPTADRALAGSGGEDRSRGERRRELRRQRIDELLSAYPAGLVVEEFISGHELSVPFLEAYPSTSSNPDVLRWNEAMRASDSEHFKEAMRTEIKSLEHADTWDVIDKSQVPQGETILPGTWSFRRKKTPSGELKKYRSRYCVRGDLQ